MIELTEQQRQLIAGHETEPIPVIDPNTQSKYVLLRADLYDRWTSLFDDEDDARGMAPLLADLDPEDWDDLSVYEGKP